MNPVRWLLLLPIFGAALLLLASTTLSLMGIHRQPILIDAQIVDWHEAAISTADPDDLKRHTDQLWTLYKDTINLEAASGRALGSAVILMINFSAGTLLFCMAAFYKSKNKTEQSDAANYRPCGTSVTIPADPASRAGIVTEASGSR